MGSRLPVGLAAAVLLLSGVASAAQASVKPWLPIVPAWDAYSVAPGERALELVYSGASCGSSQRNVHATVRETGASVAITMELEEQEPSWAGEPGISAPPCAPPFEATLRVPLSHRLAGRPIEGRSEATLQRGEHSLSRPALASGLGIPRLAGFAPADAEHVLKRMGVRWRVVADRHGPGHTRVVRQTPGPGRPFAEGGVVKLWLRGP